MPVVNEPYSFNEKSTALFVFNFFDENDDPTSCTEFKWTLSNDSGVVINGRTEVTGTPGVTVDVLLSGLDLAIQSATDVGKRILTTKAKYNSTRGTGLPINEEIIFNVRKLVNVS